MNFSDMTRLEPTNDTKNISKEYLENSSSTHSKDYRYDVAHMKAAISYAELSFAMRKKVGALLVKDNRPLCCGFNGTSPGQDNVCEKKVICPTCFGKGTRGNFIVTSEELKGGEGCVSFSCQTCDGNKIILETKDEVHHAERNLLGYANRYGIPTKDCKIYVTLSPCVECAKQMELAGIREVIYYEKYRNTDGIDYLKSRNIICRQLKF